MHNYFLYTGKLSDTHIVTNEEGWIATVQSMPFVKRCVALSACGVDTFEVCSRQAWVVMAVCACGVVLPCRGVPAGTSNCGW